MDVECRSRRTPRGSSRRSVDRRGWCPRELSPGPGPWCFVVLASRVRRLSAGCFQVRSPAAYRSSMALEFRIPLQWLSPLIGSVGFPIFILKAVPLRFLAKSPPPSSVDLLFTGGGRLPLALFLGPGGRGSVLADGGGYALSDPPAKVPRGLRRSRSEPLEGSRPTA